MFGGKKEKKKFCPFMGAISKCHKEKCMHWNSYEQDCNINVIAKKLPMLQEVFK